MELLLEKNKDVYMKYFNINRKKFNNKRIVMALLFVALISTVAFVANLFSSPLFFLLLAVLSGFIGYKVPYIEVLGRVKRVDLLKHYMFPDFLRYFISLINTQGNVYHTLKETLPYLEDPIRHEVDVLVKSIEEESTNNYHAFLDFANFIGSSEAHMVINMISQFYEEGINKEDIKELERTINELSQNRTNELISKKVGSLEKHADPILFYALGFIMLFVGVVFTSYFQMLQLF